MVVEAVDGDGDAGEGLEEVEVGLLRGSLAVIRIGVIPLHLPSKPPPLQRIWHGVIIVLVIMLVDGVWRSRRVPLTVARPLLGAPNRVILCGVQRGVRRFRGVPRMLVKSLHGV